MEIKIKGRHNLKIPESLKIYIEEKINKPMDDSKEPTVCEVMLADTSHLDSKESKVVHVSCSIAGIKAPVYVDIASDDFYKAIDLISDKLKRALHNAKR